MPRTELARLTRSLNVMLRVIDEDGRRGVHVDWARRGRAGVTVWDDSGPGKGRRKQSNGRSMTASRKLTESASKRQPRPASPTRPRRLLGARLWGSSATRCTRGTLTSWSSAEHAPKTAGDMWALWIADVQARKAAQADQAAETPGDILKG